MTFFYCCRNHEGAGRQLRRNHCREARGSGLRGRALSGRSARGHPVWRSSRAGKGFSRRSQSLALPSNLLHQLIHRLVVEVCNCIEYFGPFTNPLAQCIGNSVNKEQQLVFVHFEFPGQFVNELLARIVAEVKSFVLDLADVRHAHVETIGQLPLGPAVRFPKFSNTFAKLYCRAPA